MSPLIEDDFGPGVYDISNDAYHADPVPDGSLSASGAKLLLPPNCPAIYRYQKDNPPVSKAVFDYGSAAHQLVLGAGAEIVEVEADSWRTNAAKAARAAAYADGNIPLLSAAVETVTAMADALRAHPIASKLFSQGKPEQSLFWRDERTGVMRRARLDWLPTSTTGRMIIPDYKTAASADPEKFQRASADFHYHQQAPWYEDGVIALGLATSAAFVFVVQEKTAPYLVTVFQPDARAMQIGRHLNRQAINIFAECSASGIWPGYSDGIELLPLPAYIERKFEDVA